MYDLDTLNTGNGAWYESVDVTRLVAADNEIRHLDDDIFPDRSVDELKAEDDEFKGTLFGGLQALDLHSNLLENITMGLRQLEYLTTLNLSKNRLTNDSIQTISEIKALKELRLAENSLRGVIPKSLYGLKDLEVLDVHGNSISELPPGLEDLVNMRILNVGGNQLRSLPFASFANSSLTELYAGGNRLAGTLIPLEFDGFPTIKHLDVSRNALTSIVDRDVLHTPEILSFHAS